MCTQQYSNTRTFHQNLVSQWNIAAILYNTCILHSWSSMFIYVFYPLWIFPAKARKKKSIPFCYTIPLCFCTSVPFTQKKKRGELQNRFVKRHQKVFHHQCSQMCKSIEKTMNTYTYNVGCLSVCMCLCVCFVPPPYIHPHIVLLPTTSLLMKMNIIQSIVGMPCAHSVFIVRKLIFFFSVSVLPLDPY